MGWGPRGQASTLGRPCPSLRFPLPVGWGAWLPEAPGSCREGLGAEGLRFSPQKCGRLWPGRRDSSGAGGPGVPSEASLPRGIKALGSGLHVVGGGAAAGSWTQAGFSRLSIVTE